MCLLNYFVSLDLQVPSHIISTDTALSVCKMQLAGTFENTA